MNRQIIDDVFDAYGTDDFEGFNLVKPKTENEKELAEYLDKLIPDEDASYFKELSGDARHERDKQIFIDGFCIAFKLCAEVYSHE